MYVFLFFLVLSAGLAGYPGAVPAAESRFSKHSGDAPAVPTTITSNKMTVRNSENQAIFEGNVILTRGPLTVNSERMIVFFHGQATAESKPSAAGEPKNNAAGTSASGRSLERVEAIGHVKIKQENSHATCQKAVYFSVDDKIILTGEPVAWEKGTRVSGKQITIYLAEERSVVEGDTHVRIEDEERSAP
jgi:lipopolysaccharide export system protein LptA